MKSPGLKSWWLNSLALKYLWTLAGPLASWPPCPWPSTLSMALFSVGTSEAIILNNHDVGRYALGTTETTFTNQNLKMYLWLHGLFLKMLCLKSLCSKSLRLKILGMKCLATSEIKLRRQETHSLTSTCWKAQFVQHFVSLSEQDCETWQLH